MLELIISASLFGGNPRQAVLMGYAGHINAMIIRDWAKIKQDPRYWIIDEFNLGIHSYLSNEANMDHFMNS